MQREVHSPEWIQVHGKNSILMDLMKMMPMGSMEGNMQGNSMDEKMKMEEMDKMITEQTQKSFPMFLWQPYPRYFK